MPEVSLHPSSQGFVRTPHPFSTIRSVRGTIPLDLVGGPLERYDLIYADPPWLYKNRSEAGADRNATSWYDCLPLEEIAAFPVGDLAAENCMLAGWCTDPLLPQQLQLYMDWGFEYVTVGFVWVKLNKKVGVRRIVDYVKDVFMGNGYWSRCNNEYIMLAKRGQPQRKSASVRQTVFHPRLRHSEKPLVFRTHLEELIAGDRRIELFSRRDPTPDWDVWGNQTGIIEANGITKRHYVPPIAPIPLFEAA